MKACYFCNFILDAKFEVFRSSTCPSCGKDLKICKACRFYSPGSHWDCAETIDEAVYDKENRNFCSYFEFQAAAGKHKEKSTTDDAKTKFNQLFGS